eukprot:c22810_g1_i3 orf=290-985(+)
MDSLNPTKRHLDLLSRYLNQAEVRDKICRTIQYGAKFVSGGTEGVADKVDFSTGTARKVFRLLKSVDELNALVAVAPKQHHKPVVFLGRSKNALMAVYLALDNLVWAGSVGIYKNKRHTELVSNVSLYFFLGGCAASSLNELYQLIQLVGKRKTDKDKVPVTTQEEEVERQWHPHALSFVKSSMDVVLAIGLLQLASKRVTPRVTGALGTVTSLITCYELFKAITLKVKTT